MIAKGLITKRANEDRMPAQTVERDYIQAQLCADIGAAGDARLVFKGGTLLRLCYLEDYRYSADLDFSAVDGLTSADAIAAIQHAAAACRTRVEFPVLEIADADGTTAWVNYVGPLGAKPRTIKLDVSDDELVETHQRLALLRRWPDLPDEAAIEGYALDEVGAEKLRCIAERGSNAATSPTPITCWAADTSMRSRSGTCTCERRRTTPFGASNAHRRHGGRRRSSGDYPHTPSGGRPSSATTSGTFPGSRTSAARRYASWAR